MSEPRTCAWCGLPLGMLPGCNAPEMAHTNPHDGHASGDDRCRDCDVEPGEHHHPLCCVAQHDDEQYLCCDCPLCLATTDITPDAHQDLLDQLARGQR